MCGSANVVSGLELRLALGLGLGLGVRLGLLKGLGGSLVN